MVPLLILNLFVRLSVCMNVCMGVCMFVQSGPVVLELLRVSVIIMHFSVVYNSEFKYASESHIPVLSIPIHDRASIIK